MGLLAQTLAALHRSPAPACWPDGASYMALRMLDRELHEAQVTGGEYPARELVLVAAATPQPVS